MPPLVSSRTRSSRRNWHYDSMNPAGEVRWITAQNLETLEQVLAIGKRAREIPGTLSVTALENPHLAVQMRMSFAPHGSWDYRTRSQPVVSLDRSAEKLATTTLGCVEVPESYHRVVMYQLKQDVFTRMWQLEHHGGKPLTAPQRSMRPTLRELETFAASKVRLALVQLLTAREWIDDPFEDPRFTEEEAIVIDELNETFKYINLGRQNHLQFSSRPGSKRMFGQKPPPTNNPAATNPYVLEYQQANAAQRKRMLQQSPFVAYLLDQAGVAQ